MPITRTRSKGYVAFCPWRDVCARCSHPVHATPCDVCGCDKPVVCDWDTPRIALRVNANKRLTQHMREVHNMKAPNKDLPEQDRGDRLTDFAGHLIVVEKGATMRKLDKPAQFTDEAVIAKVWVHVSGSWKCLGDTPIFFRTVQKQLLADNDDDFGGVLLQGTDRNPKEWAIVGARNAEEEQILASWDRNADSF